MKHEWKRGRTVDTPDNPSEGYSYCDNCCAEETDDNKDEDCETSEPDEINSEVKMRTPEGAVLVAKMQAMNPMQWPPDASGRSQENVQLFPVYSDDPESTNRAWAVATPSGNLQLTISNPHAQGRIKQGQEYYVFIVPTDAWSETSRGAAGET